MRELPERLDGVLAQQHDVCMDLRWKASFSASCLHAALCMREGLPVADSTILPKLQPAADALCSELQACGFDVDGALPLLVDLSSDYENNRQLIEMAAKRVLGARALSEAAILRLAGSVADLEASWLREQPGLVEELSVRGRPLREQWEARGPGLLKVITKLTDDHFLAPSAEVVLVSPVVGGHGRAHLPSNRVTFEAVLTHPHSDLPETLRLGWLLSQVNLEVPALGESVSRERLPTLASLATLPLILAAAERVELATLDEPSLARAQAAWYLPAGLPANTPSILLDWWQAYESRDTRWPVAMSALEQMMSGS